MSLDTILAPFREINDILVAGKMSFNDPFFSSIFKERTAFEREEMVERSLFQSMQALVLVMVGFFCLFIYYCVFGFVLGAIQESSGEIVPQHAEVKKETKSADVPASPISSETPDSPETPKKNSSKSQKKQSSAKKSHRKG